MLFSQVILFFRSQPCAVILILAATNLGLGTCWIAAFNMEAARSVLHLPADAEPVIFTPLGYPADLPGPKIRKPLADLVRYEHW